MTTCSKTETKLDQCDDALTFVFSKKICRAITEFGITII